LIFALTLTLFISITTGLNIYELNSVYSIKSEYYSD